MTNPGEHKSDPKIIRDGVHTLMRQFTRSQAAAARPLLEAGALLGEGKQAVWEPLYERARDAGISKINADELLSLGKQMGAQQSEMKR